MFELEVKREKSHVNTVSLNKRFKPKAIEKCANQETNKRCNRNAAVTHWVVTNRLPRNYLFMKSINENQVYYNQDQPQPPLRKSLYFLINVILLHTYFFNPAKHESLSLLLSGISGSKIGKNTQLKVIIPNRHAKPAKHPNNYDFQVV